MLRLTGAAKAMAAAFALAAMPAGASEWWYVNSGPGRVVFVDAQSVERRKGVVSYWTMYVIRPGEPEVMTKSRRRAQCDRRRIETLEVLRFDDRGREIGAGKPRSEPPQAVAPDTLGDAEMRFACGDEGHRVVNDLFPLAVDEVAFAEALIAHGNRPADAHDLHEAMSGRAVADQAVAVPSPVALVDEPDEPDTPAQAPDDDTEVGQFEDACAGGDADSCTLLGIAYHEGTGVPPDAERAAASFARACDLGGASACGNFGLALVKGEGIEKDAPRAFAYFEAACDAGNAASCSSLGASYSLGVGVRANPARARRLFEKSCDGDDPGGCYNLGVVYDQGLGVRKDPRRAAKLYVGACDRDDGAACGNLGTLVQNGTGIAKNAARAAELFRKSCDLGDADGCLNLGRAYYAGAGVPRDREQAEIHYRRSLAIEPDKTDARRALNDLLPD